MGPEPEMGGAQGCLWPACRNDAGPDGYCPIHAEMSVVEQRTIMQRIREAARTTAERTLQNAQRARHNRHSSKRRSKRLMANQSRARNR